MLVSPGATSVRGVAAVHAEKGVLAGWFSANGPFATGFAPARSTCGNNSGAVQDAIMEMKVNMFGWERLACLHVKTWGTNRCYRSGWPL